MKDIIKHYSNDDITIAWQPSKCIHAAECVKSLPNVYHPESSPWMTIENATTQELQEQIKKCPSGALSYTMKNEENNSPEATATNIDILKNGPLLVHGKINVTNADGSKVVKEKTTAFCRCGASSNKPYCDGQHNKVSFEG